MDHRTLFMQHIFLSVNGFALTSEEKTTLQGSLLLLKNDELFQKVVYWGKILGIKKDYHIAQGYKGAVTEERKSFYSDDSGNTWKQLPVLRDSEIPYVQKIKGVFVGDASYVHEFDPIPEVQCLGNNEENAIISQTSLEASPDNADKANMDHSASNEKDEEDENETNETGDQAHEEQKDHEEEEEQGDGDDDRKKEKTIPKVKVIEEMRLSYVVKEIDQCTSVVPRGAYVLRSSNSVEENPSFKGLSHEESCNMKSYMHMTKTNSSIILSKSGIQKALDFAETIDEDIPKNCWSLQYDESVGAVIGRSLLWPGYIFYHVPESKIFGSFYIGNGEKNLDLCFML